MDVAGEPAVIQDYAQIWRAAEKVVYSSTLQAASSSRTRLERAFDPEAVRRMKAQAVTDISVGGPALPGTPHPGRVGAQDPPLLNPNGGGAGPPGPPSHIRATLALGGE